MQCFMQPYIAILSAACGHDLAVRRSKRPEYQVMQSCSGMYSIYSQLIEILQHV